METCSMQRINRISNREKSVFHKQRVRRLKGELFPDMDVQCPVWMPPDGITASLSLRQPCHGALISNRLPLHSQVNSQMLQKSQKAFFHSGCLPFKLYWTLWYLPSLDYNPEKPGAIIHPQLGHLLIYLTFVLRQTQSFLILCTGQCVLCSVPVTTTLLN